MNATTRWAFACQASLASREKHNEKMTEKVRILTSLAPSRRPAARLDQRAQLSPRLSSGLAPIYQDTKVTCGRIHSLEDPPRCFKEADDRWLNESEIRPEQFTRFGGTTAMLRKSRGDLWWNHLRQDIFDRNPFQERDSRCTR